MSSLVHSMQKLKTTGKQPWAQIELSDRLKFIVFNQGVDVAKNRTMYRWKCVISFLILPPGGHILVWSLSVIIWIWTHLRSFLSLGYFSLTLFGHLVCHSVNLAADD